MHSAISHLGSTRPAWWPAATVDGIDGGTAVATGTAVAARSEATIAIVTDDGDRVTLSSVSSRSAVLATYTARGRMDGEEFTAEAAAFATSGSDHVTLSVEGQLDRDEIRDIAKVLRALQRRRPETRGFVRSLQARLDHGDLDSIASVAARVSAQVKLGVAGVVVTAPGPKAPDPPVVTA